MKFCACTWLTRGIRGRPEAGDTIARMRFLSRLLLLLALIGPARVTLAEDGYELWLRYRPVPAPWVDEYRRAASEVVLTGTSPTLAIAGSELTRGLAGILGAPPPAVAHPTRDGSLILGTPRSSAEIASLQLGLDTLGAEGYVIRSLTLDRRRVTVIAANTDIGVLYGAFQFLKLLQTRQSLAHLDSRSVPRIRRRILDHWDNLDRTIERGYAGQSIWDWHKLPDYLDPRYTDYARACASLGINGMVPTNVAANANSLTPRYIAKLAALANLFRPYGLRVYLTARFSAPIEIGGLKTADPLDAGVRAWWRAKGEEIYAAIPDFGGFLVKADSEGQPGPHDYGRTHAEGANMLAESVGPHGGIVMWRAFVYTPDPHADRAAQAFHEFVPLDGQFRDNVMLQVKNGPIDFQPREPFHPLFGATPRTKVMLELQITKEYLGFATHLVYLAPLFEETLRSDTYVRGPGSTVARVVDGSLFRSADTGIAGVANVGSDRNWSGSVFDQANWYAFGRLAWDPDLSARDIAVDWLRMTFTNDADFVEPVTAMMLESREVAVDYMTPLGLHHQMARDSHYGPGPWITGGPRIDWTSVYFNHADALGIGFDRTASGSNAVALYAPQVAAQFADLAQVPDRLLLWFHHVPWDYRMRSGRTLWDELVIHYDRGVRAVTAMRHTWAGLAGKIDAERYDEVSSFLAIQEHEATWWRDASIAYFQSLSRRPLPPGYASPEHDLAYYEALCFPYAPGIAPAAILCAHQ
jgi:alpha-glucuronidase